MRRYLLYGPAIAVMLAMPGCNEMDDRADPAADAAVTDTADSATDPDRAVCLQGDPFVADGSMATGPVGHDNIGAGEPERIAALRWERYDGCERFVIDLEGPDGAVATGAGDVDVELLRDLGVVRVSLRDVERVDRDAAGATFEGPLARAAYAVWSPEGRWTYVDLHLGDPAEAFATVLGDPARVVVDLRPGGGLMPDPPAAADRVVVLRPRAGSTSYPLEVMGYARTFEANVVARVEYEGEEVHETFTTATAWVDAWGHYSMTIEDGPTGAIQLHVGEYSARDGTWEGVTVELEMR